MLFLAGLGIIVRGAGYALRSGTGGGATLRAIDGSFALASLLTPFALGAAAGAIASLRVPAASSGAHPFSSWLNPTSVLVGILAVAFSAYLAAVFLAADADRLGDIELTAAFRRRALGSGTLAGAVALAGLIVLRSDARSLLDELLSGSALAAVIGSALAGVLALALVWRGRFEAARYTAAVAVATVVGGWALARYPTLLRGLTVSAAAAPHDTLVALLVAIAAGAVLLFPSLGWLFSLQLSGGFDPGVTGSSAAGGPGGAAGPTGAAGPAGAAGPTGAAGGGDSVPAFPARVPIALTAVGIGLLNVASAPWAHTIGVLALLAAVIGGVLAIVPRALADADRSG